LNESRAISKFATNGHENLVQVLDNGTLSPFLYFLDMELCDGNLRELVLETELPERYLYFKSEYETNLGP